MHLSVMRMDVGLVLRLCLCLAALWGFSRVVEGCPSPCVCPNSTQQVSCAGAELEDIPRSLQPSLTTLDMSSNKLHSLTSTMLAHLRNIVNLKLTENEIETIHDGALEALQSLQTLDLSSNRLTRLNERTFQGAKSLLHLDISKNQLSTIDGAFSEMSELSRLDLRSNQITRITQFTFRDLVSLRHLLLGSNKISHIDRRAFKNLEKLTYLVLKGNSIGDVTHFQFNSYSLSYVDLSECNLTKVPRGLPNSIRYLQLRRNNMTVIHRHTFQDCPFVSILVLDDNGIGEIHDRTFEKMKYLQQLWLNSNQLKTIPHPLPPSLQRLLMDSNMVEYVRDVFPIGSQIHTLSFMGNNISHVMHDAFLKLSELTSLDLSNNKIRHVYGFTYLNNSKLKTLQLSKNPLSLFHSHCFQGLTSLTTLSLAYILTNVSMHEDIFEDLQALSKLDLDSSPMVVKTILSKEGTLLSALSHVEDLSLHSCDLTHLRENFPGFFPDLGVLHISSSRWHCDTSMVWFRNWLHSTAILVEKKDELTCFTPRQLHGRAVTSLMDYEFAQATTPKFTTTLPNAGPVTTFPTPITMLARSSTTTSTTTVTPNMAGPASEDKDIGGEPDIDHVGQPPIDLDAIKHTVEEINNPDSGSSRHLHPEDDQVGRSTSRFPTSEEVLSGATKVPNGGRSINPTRSSTSLEHYNGLESDNLEINTLSLHPQTTVLPRLVTAARDSKGIKPALTSTTIIIIATTIGTIIVAGILIFAIVFISRKQKLRAQNKHKNGGGEIYQNGIKYHHRNDVLYFMPRREPNGSADHHRANGSATTDSTKTTSSTKSKEGMSLIPGRDINHEGPLRVYKWEDF